ncbi:MAG TPA: hypothetical protein VEY12_05175 [Thermoplasmata archaeon]|nr:hypothetical protein [Thermoplasmata archaeon]
MPVLFASGAMSLVWMAGISAVSFVEKRHCRPLLTSRAIGVPLVVRGGLVVLGAAPLLRPLPEGQVHTPPADYICRAFGQGRGRSAIAVSFHVSNPYIFE